MLLIPSRVHPKNYVVYEKKHFVKLETYLPPPLWKKTLYGYVLSCRQKASQSEKGILYSTVQYTPRYPAPILCLPVMKKGEKGNIFFLPRVRGGGGGPTGAFEREGGQDIIQSRKRREKTGECRTLSSFPQHTVFTG